MSNAALLLMDFQAGEADEAWAAVAVERAAVARVAARQRGLLTVFTHVSFREGFPEVSARNEAFWGLKKMGALPTGPARFLPSLAPGEGELVVAKNRFSAYCGNDLDSLLRARSVTKLLLAGITTSGVVLSTSLVASDLDFEVAVLTDAYADDDGTLHQALVSDCSRARATSYLQATGLIALPLDVCKKDETLVEADKRLKTLLCKDL